MNKPITYSFIIPHKNTPKLLQRCLDSIPQRNDIEIIVVDNNSSPDIVDFNNFPGNDRSDVTIIYDNNSIGAGGTRNTGLAQAKGIWVLFADADDYYSDGFLDVLDQYIDREIDVVYFNFNRIKDGKITGMPYSLQYLKKAYTEKDSEDLIRYKYAVPWVKMIRLNFLFNYHVAFEDCLVANDLFFSYQVGFFARSIIIESSKIYNYVINEESISTKRRNTTEYYECIFRHYYQNKEFYKFINHPEWISPLITRLIWVVWKKGIFQFFLAFSVLFRNYNNIIKAKDYFVDHIINEIRNHHSL